MSQLITQITLYAYPLWALIAFGMAVVSFTTWFFVDHDRKTMLWGIVFLGWSLAFFGAGLLIARVGDPKVIGPRLAIIWIMILPVFAYTVGLECVRLYRVLKMIEAMRKRRAKAYGKSDR